MAHILANIGPAAHLTKREGLRVPRPSPAKANLTAREVALGKRPRIGAALKRAIDICCAGDIKEAAIVLGFQDVGTGEVKHAQVSRMIAGAEPVQLDRIYGTKLHGPFAIEMARDHDDCVVETTVTYTARRSA